MARPSGKISLMESQRAVTSCLVVPGVTRISTKFTLPSFRVISCKTLSERIIAPFSTTAWPSMMPTTGSSSASICTVSPGFFFSTSAASRPMTTARSVALWGRRPSMTEILSQVNPPHSRPEIIIMGASSMLSICMRTEVVAATFGRGAIFSSRDSSKTFGINPPLILLTTTSIPMTSSWRTMLFSYPHAMPTRATTAAIPMEIPTRVNPVRTGRRTRLRTTMVKNVIGVSGLRVGAVGGHDAAVFHADRSGRLGGDGWVMSDEDQGHA